MCEIGGAGAGQKIFLSKRPAPSPRAGGGGIFRGTKDKNLPILSGVLTKAVQFLELAINNERVDVA